LVYVIVWYVTTLSAKLGIYPTELYKNLKVFFAKYDHIVT